MSHGLVLGLGCRMGMGKFRPFLSFDYLALCQIKVLSTCNLKNIQETNLERK